VAGSGGDARDLIEQPPAVGIGADPLLDGRAIGV
jgi:hypothetical protein